MASDLSEKERLRGFVLAVWEVMLPDTPAESLEPIRTSNRIDGLREAARDVVEMCADLADADLRELDSRLEQASLPTLSQMRDRRFRDFQTILGRGAIRSAEEFRLLDSFVGDVYSLEISPQDRALAESLLSAFEA